MVRPVPAGRRGSCCTPYSRLQEEIDNVETIAVTANNTANNASQLAQQALTRDTFDDVNVNGDLNVYGDIIQQGAAYETHAQHVFSTDDYIVMRDGALVGLAVGDYSGFQVKKYDGTNDGRLVIDRDGTARVGDVGDEQPLLTRDESADMVDAAPLVWDAANSKAVSGAFPVPDPGVASINGISPDANNDFTIEAGTNVTITAGTNKITINAAGGGSWTRRTASDDWTDMFEIVNISGTNYVKAKKNIVMQMSNSLQHIFGSTFIPKGFIGNYYGINLNVAGLRAASDNTLQIPEYGLITPSNIASNTTYITIYRIKATAVLQSDNTIRFDGNSDNYNLSKAGFLIFTSD